MAKIRQQQKRAALRKQQARRKILIYGGLGLLAAALVLGIAYLASRAPGGLLGEEVPVASAEHVAEGSDPGPYASNPPAGGTHYASELEAGFYEEDAPEAGMAYPAGPLVHNLEHGYVIFWYNCAAYEGDCSTLKETIRAAMDKAGRTKLIAFPWTDMQVPLAMTSWGRIMEFRQIDNDLMVAFALNNRNHAPESYAD
jgi:hypothetical protein